MTDELIEQVARAICAANDCDPANWNLWKDDAKAAIAAMQPHIEAQREDAARRALEAASAFALDREEWAVIRSIPTAQFRRPPDQPKENTDG